MTVAPEHGELHELVDQLSPDEALLISAVIRKIVHSERPEASAPSGIETPVAPRPAGHRFSFIGIMDGDPDLAARSAQILRDELGDPTT